VSRSREGQHYCSIYLGECVDVGILSIISVELSLLVIPTICYIVSEETSTLLYPKQFKSSPSFNSKAATLGHRSHLPSACLTSYPNVWGSFSSTKFQNNLLHSNK
jgi:hypothetical protein